MVSEAEQNKQILGILTELNELQILKSKIYLSIYIQENYSHLQKKVHELEREVENALKVYELEHEVSDQLELFHKYRDFLKELFKEYDLQYMNIQKELQRAEQNQQNEIVKARVAIKERDEKYKEFKATKKRLKEEIDDILKEDIKNKEYLHLVEEIKSLKNPLDEYNQAIDSCLKSCRTCEKIIKESMHELKEASIKKRKRFEEIDTIVRGKNLVVIKDRHPILETTAYWITKLRTYKAFSFLSKKVKRRKFSKQMWKDLEKRLDELDNSIKEETTKEIHSEVARYISKVYEIKNHD